MREKRLLKYKAQLEEKEKNLLDKQISWVEEMDTGKRQSMQESIRKIQEEIYMLNDVINGIRKEIEK